MKLIVLNSAHPDFTVVDHRWQITSDLLEITQKHTRGFIISSSSDASLPEILGYFLCICVF